MGLEIEFEDEDSAEAEAEFEAERAPYQGAPRRRWALALTATAAAVAVTAVAGLDIGRTAQQARSRAILRLAPSESYVIDALPASSPSPAEGSGVERAVLLRVLNDGPRPVTVLGGTLSSPDFATVRLLPDAGGALKPGGVGTLRAVARLACGGGPGEGTEATFAEVSFATVADIDLRTSDGLSHRVSIIVQQYNALAMFIACGLPGSRT